MLIAILLTHFFGNPSFGAKCDFQKVEVQVRDDKLFRKHNLTIGLYTLIFGGPQNTERALNGAESYEGGIHIQYQDSRCSLEPFGVFSSESLQVEKAKGLLMVRGIDGSKVTSAVFNMKDCTLNGKAEYFGKAEIKNDRLVNEPSCEPLDSKGALESCQQGKVFVLNPKTCAPAYDKKESKKWTQKFLGVDIPEGKVLTVANPRTKKAKIVRDPK
jgi:hypothetical protein